MPAALLLLQPCSCCSSPDATASADSADASTQAEGEDCTATGMDETQGVQDRVGWRCVPLGHCTEALPNTTK